MCTLYEGRTLASADLNLMHYYFLQGELQNLEVQLHQRELRCQENLAQRLLQFMLTRHCPDWQLPSLNNRHLLSQLLLGDSRICRGLHLLQTTQLQLAWAAQAWPGLGLGMLMTLQRTAAMQHSTTTYLRSLPAKQAGVRLSMVTEMQQEQVV